METLWVDIGATDADDARSLVSIGDTAVLVGPPRELANGQLAGKALDNRTGAWIVLEAARRVAERGGGAVPVVACACAIEETLGDGARARRTASIPRSRSSSTSRTPRTCRAACSARPACRCPARARR